MVLTLIGYGVFNGRNLILGPTIEITYPKDNMETTEKLIAIRGKANNVVFLSLNNRPIFIDTENNFEEKLLLYPGFNIISIYGKDRFKNEVIKEFRLYYKENNQIN